MCVDVTSPCLVCELAALTATASKDSQGTGRCVRQAAANVPDVDGILFEAGRLWAVQNSDQVTELRLSPDLSSATVERVITSGQFQVPTTVASQGSRLAVVNAKFDTGFPPTATSFEVVIVDGR